MAQIKKWTLSAISQGAIASLAFATGIAATGQDSIAGYKKQYGSDLQVLGEAEQIDFANGMLVVAGQHIAISKETVFSIEGVPAIDVLRTFHRGDVLAVSGPLGAAARINKLNMAYVPGATTVFVKGKIGAIESAIGVAQIGDMRVDLTPAMSDPGFSKVEAG